MRIAAKNISQAIKVEIDEIKNMRLYKTKNMPIIMFTMRFALSFNTRDRKPIIIGISIVIADTNNIS
jgi:hypothetical protein